jgi:hypothetical protein
VAELHLFRDVLDKQMSDLHGRRCGKADGLVMRVGSEGQPEVIGIEVGGGTLARRLGRRTGPWLARWASALARWLGVRDGAAYRIPWRRVQRVHLEVELDLDAPRSGLEAAERRLRERIVGRIPGA